jgi:hypothetical protein
MTTPNFDDVLTAFSEARTAAPQNRALLRVWTTQYPQFADDLIQFDFAWAATGMTLTGADSEWEELPADEVIVAMGRECLLTHDQTDAPPMTSLIGSAAARGLDVPRLAKRLRLDRLLLSRLEQRTLEAASLPQSLIAQLAETLDRTSEEIAAYLQAPPRLAAQAHFKSRQAPALVAEPGVPRQTFADALKAGQTLTEADQAYWQAEIAAGVLGDEPSNNTL